MKTTQNYIKNSGYQNNLFTPELTWRIIRKWAPFSTTKRKGYLCLHEKLEITSYRGENLLRTKSKLIKYTHNTSSPFTAWQQGLKAMFSHSIPWQQSLWSARLMFTILLFPKHKLSNTLLDIHSMNKTRNWRHSSVETT